jgi:uncharacterized repeat protein (TIGR01451 family)
MRLTALVLVLVGSTAAAQTVEVMSRADPPSLLGTGGALDVLLAPDGRTVFLMSDSAVVAGAPNPGRNRRLYAHDVPTGALAVVADFAEARAASADGRILIVETSNHALVPGAPQVQVLAIDRATGTHNLVSHVAGNPTQPVNDPARAVAVSADGRFVLFDTRAPNVVPGQVEPSGGGSTNDVFLYDRDTGLNTLVSGVGTETLFASCAAESLSPDGRWATFRVVTSPISMISQVVVWDRLSATFAIVSHPPGSPTVGTIGTSQMSQSSADGAWVVFDSNASQLLGTSVVIPRSVFLYERATGLVSLVSDAAGAPGTPANGPSGDARITPDGATVVYTSGATDLVAGQADANGGADVFAFDRATGTTRLLSRAVGSVATAANGAAIPTSVALSGAHALFRSDATNLVALQDDVNGAPDLFAVDLSSGAVSLASHRTGSSVETGGAGVSASAAAASGWVAAFISAAPDLADQPDANDAPDPFLVTLGAPETLALLPQDPTTLRRTGNGTSQARVDFDFSNRPPRRHLSADGRFAVFDSEATDLVPGPIDVAATQDVFLFDRAQGTVTLVSRSAASPATAVGGREASISRDGRLVAFASASTALVPGQVDTNDALDLFLFDRLTGEMQLVSHVPGAATTTADRGTGSNTAWLSSDGSALAFESTASNLVAGQVDPPATADVFVFDRPSGAVTLVSHAAGLPTQAASGPSEGPSLSSDGRFVAFQSLAGDLVPGQSDPATTWDVFLHDRQTGVTTLASHVPGSATVVANDHSWGSLVAANGRVAFASSATDLVAGQTEGNDGADLFLYEQTSGALTLVSHAAGAPGVTANTPAKAFALAPDGGHVAYHSAATNLVAGQADANGASDAFLYDAVTNASRLVSHAAGASSNAAAGATPPPFEYAPPTLSDDGRRVAFVSSATDLAADPPSGQAAYLFDAATDASALVSRPSEPTQAYTAASTATVSADGNFVAFTDSSADLVPGDLNQRSDVFLFGPVHTALDLRVGLSDSADPVTTGQTFRYQATLSNAGPAPASGVTLTIAVPAGVVFVGATPGPPVCTAAAGVVRCALGALAVGAEAVVDVDVAATVASGLLECAAHVVANEPDTNRTDDAAVETTRVDPADVAVSMDGPAAPVAAGVPFAYALSITNAGPAPADGVVLTDQLPAGLTFVSSTPGPPACTHAAGLFRCEVGTLAAAGAFAVSLQVLPAGYTSVTNEATVTSDSHDPDLADNVARVTTALAPGFGVELAHGSALLRDLSALPGPVAREERYRLARPPYTSWEVSVDGASGDVSGAGDTIALERLGPDSTTLLQSALADGTGQAVRLTVQNASEAAVEDEVIRVRSTGCSSDCGPDDVYRVRARETTLTVPRFNNSATQATVLLLQNREARPVSGHAWFWSPTGMLLASRSFALAPRGSFVLATAALPGLAGVSGSITVTHDGPYAALAGKAVALEPATGFAFDAPLAVRMR